MSLFKLWILVLTPLFLMGCSNDDMTQPSQQQVPESASIRVIHASPDAPTINIAIDGTVIGALVGVNYQTASELLPVGSGVSYDFAVQAIRPLAPLRY